MRGSGRGLAVAALLTVALAGCGSGGHVGGHLDMSGQTPPANAVNMSVSVIGRTVTVSPARIGAGEMAFTIVNTGTASESLVARSAGGHPLSVVLADVPAGGTAQMKVDLRPGRYRIGSPVTGETAIVSGHRSLRAATLIVGPSRSGGDSSIEQP